MKKLISFTMFLKLVLVVVFAKTSQAQVTVIKVKSGVAAPTRISVNGFWKWSPRFQRYVWVEGHWAHHARRSIRVRTIR